MEMDAKQLTEYLKHVSELEASVYKQKETETQVKACLKYPERLFPKVKKPTKKTFTAPQPPKEPDSDASTNDGSFFTIPVIFLTLGIICLIVGIVLEEFSLVGVAVLSIIVSFLIGAVFSNLLKEMKEKKSNEKTKYYAELNNYEIALEKHNELVQIEEEEYQNRLKKYQRALESETALCEKKNEVARANYLTAKQSIEYLSENVENTQKILNDLYDKGIIFEKYRNMIAMCTIYEYFSSGRCDELTGPNGAYNLYEAELRQNVIINQLENINANLAQIRDNQYVLYKAIEDTNNLIREVSGAVRRIATSSEIAAEANLVTAHYSAITAANTEAIAYLEILNLIN